MERNFFTWKGWDQYDTMVIGFTQCVVTKAFGPFVIGDKLNSVTIDYGKGVIEVWTDDSGTPAWVGNLVLSIEAVP